MAAYDIYADPGCYPGCAKCKKIASCNEQKAESTRAAIERKRISGEAVRKLVRN